MKKLIIGVVLFSLIAMIGTCVYFVAGVSATYPPIATYNYQGNIDSLVMQLRQLNRQNKGLTFAVTDTTGTDKTGLAYYIKLTWITPSSGTIEYGIKLDKTDNWFTKNKTVIDMVEAINLTHLSGGYSSTAKGVKPLVSIFDKEVMPGLTHSER